MDKIKDYLPLLSAGLVTAAVLRLVLYYNYFGVDIVSYIDFSEAFVLSTPALFYFSAILICALLINFIFRRQDKSLIIPDLNQSEKSFKKRFSQFNSPASYYFLVYVVPIVSACIILTGYFLGMTETIEWYVTSTFTLILSTYHETFANEISLRINKITGKFIYRTEISLYLTLPILILFAILATRYQAFYLVYGDSKEISSVTMTVDGKEVKSTDKYRYVGKTKSYVFFYDISTGRASAFAVGDIKNFSIRDGSPHLEFKKL